MSARFEIVRTDDGWHSRLIAANNQVVLTSDTYMRSRPARRAIEIARAAFYDAGWITDIPGVTRNEALKLCGNGVVPQQAEAAIRFLLPLIGRAAA